MNEPILVAVGATSLQWVLVDEQLHHVSDYAIYLQVNVHLPSAQCAVSKSE